MAILTNNCRLIYIETIKANVSVLSSLENGNYWNINNGGQSYMCFANADVIFLQESAVTTLCKKEFSDEEEQSN